MEAPAEIFLVGSPEFGCDTWKIVESVELEDGLPSKSLQRAIDSDNSTPPVRFVLGVMLDRAVASSNSYAERAEKAEALAEHWKHVATSTHETNLGLEEKLAAAEARTGELQAELAEQAAIAEAWKMVSAGHMKTRQAAISLLMQFPEYEEAYKFLTNSAPTPPPSSPAAAGPGEASEFFLNGDPSVNPFGPR